jgi:hypothetical protein
MSEVVPAFRKHKRRTLGGGLMNPLHLRSKWTKYKVMRRFEDLRRHLPETRKMTQKNFEDMITQYGDVVIKPISGSRGAGVIRVSGSGQDTYVVHTENRKKTITGKQGAYEYVTGMTRSRSHIIQRRIPLATVDDRPFDIRVIVQRRRTGAPWEVTGQVAKVAGKGYIVTNIQRSKGTVLPVTTALKRSSLRHRSSRIILADISKVALLAARRLSRSKLYSDKRIFGFDMGLDQDGNVWIIEANLKPMLSHFLKLKNKTMYRRIMAYK